MFLSDKRSADATHRMRHREETADALDNEVMKADGPAVAEGIRRKAESVRGGVLKNFKYAQKILKQREADVRNQQLVEDGLPREETLVELDPIESRKLELRQLLQILLNNITSGNTSAFGFLEIKNIIRLLISLSPILTEAEMTEIIQALDDASEDLNELLNDNREASMRDKRVDRTIGALYTISNLVNDMRNFLEKMITKVNESLENKKASAVQFAKEFSATKKIIGDKSSIQRIRDDIRDALDTVIDRAPAPPPTPQPQDMVRIDEEEEMFNEDLLPSNIQQIETRDVGESDESRLAEYKRELQKFTYEELQPLWIEAFSQIRRGRPKEMPSTKRKLINQLVKKAKEELRNE
jgi:hypothetical protein